MSASQNLAVRETPMNVMVVKRKTKEKKSDDVTLDIAIDHLSLALPEKVSGSVTQRRGRLSPP